MGKTIEFYTLWENERKKDPDAVPDKDVMDYFQVKENLTTEVIVKMRKDSTKDLAILDKGSVWRAPSFFMALRMIAYPDHYYAQY